MTFPATASPVLICMMLAGLPSIGHCQSNPSLPADPHGGAVQARTETSGLRAKQEGLQSLLGREIRTRNDELSGRIIDVLTDADGRVRAAVVELGGFLGIGTRKIVVEWNAIRFVDNGEQPASIVLDLARDELRQAPEYKAGDTGARISR